MRFQYGANLFQSSGTDATLVELEIILLHAPVVIV